jgi:hypothetical protein
MKSFIKQSEQAIEKRLTEVKTEHEKVTQLLGKMWPVFVRLSEKADDHLDSQARETIRELGHFLKKKVPV